MSFSNYLRHIPILSFFIGSTEDDAPQTEAKKIATGFETANLEDFCPKRRSTHTNEHGVVACFAAEHGALAGIVAAGKNLFVARYVWELRLSETDGNQVYKCWVKSSHSNSKWYEVVIVLRGGRVTSFRCAWQTKDRRVCKHCVATVCGIETEIENYTSWRDLPADEPRYQNPNYGRAKKKNLQRKNQPMYTFDGPIGVRACLRGSLLGARRLKIHEFELLYPSRSPVAIGSEKANKAKRRISTSRGGSSKRRRTEASMQEAGGSSAASSPSDDIVASGDSLPDGNAQAEGQAGGVADEDDEGSGGAGEGRGTAGRAE